MIFIGLALGFFVLRNKKMIYFSSAFSLTEKNGFHQKIESSILFTQNIFRFSITNTSDFYFYCKYLFESTKLCSKINMGKSGRSYTVIVRSQLN